MCNRGYNAERYLKLHYMSLVNITGTGLPAGFGPGLVTDTGPGIRIWTCRKPVPVARTRHFVHVWSFLFLEVVCCRLSTVFSPSRSCLDIKVSHLYSIKLLTIVIHLSSNSKVQIYMHNQQQVSRLTNSNTTTSASHETTGAEAEQRARA
jgi:hypothetical protein